MSQSSIPIWLTHYIFKLFILYGTESTSIRISVRITQEHQSHWFAKKSMYPILMLEDRLIRSYCHEKYAAAGIVTIKIERYVDHMRVYLEVARPNVLAGSRGQDLETTRQRLVHEIVQFRKKNGLRVNWLKHLNYI